MTNNPNITLDIIQANPDKDWDWKLILLHPNITWEIIRDNPDKDWDWEIIQAHPDKHWNWERLSVHLFNHIYHMNRDYF